MLITFLFNIFVTFINWFLGLLPTVQYAINWNEYTAPVAHYVAMLDVFVSLDVIVACIAVIMIIDNWGFIYSFGLEILEKIPFIG